jgi:uncharacterized protein
MDERVLAAMIHGFVDGGDSPTVFAWQGGEPTLAGPGFYRTALRWQRRFARQGQRVVNTFQTNGVLIDEEWADLLAESQFLVGLSIDGPPDVHDVLRRSADGSGSHVFAARAWRLLQERGCEVNLLCVVHPGNCEHATRVYRHMTDALGAEHLQFIPYIETDRLQPTERVPGAGDYGRFLVELFEVWATEPRPTSIKLFDDVVLFLAGKPMRDCMHRNECDSHLVVECDGSVYPCDFFVDREHCLGNVTASSISEIRNLPAAGAFRQRKEQRRPKACLECRHLDVCQSGCCRFWRRTDKDGWSQGLCLDLLFFFDHCRTEMEGMAASIRERWRGLGLA